MRSLRMSVVLTMILAQVFWPLSGYANPVGEVVTSGLATFDRTAAHTLTVNQASDKLITNWQGFSISVDETTKFVQPGSGSIALNRVVSGEPSNIFGNLNSNGKVFLINQNGILFAPGSHVNVGGLIASTLDISDARFLSNQYSSENDLGSPVTGNGYDFAETGRYGSVTNHGAILSNAPGGYAALLGNSVKNAGTITAAAGTVILGSGKEIAVNLDPWGGISAVVLKRQDNNPFGVVDGIRNSGTITASGGAVILTARSLKGLFMNLINNDGIIEADGIHIDANDRIVLTNTLTGGGGVGNGVRISGGEVVIHDADIIVHSNASSWIGVQYDGSLNITNSRLLSTSDLTNTTGPAGAATVFISGRGMAQILNSQLKAIINSTITNFGDTHTLPTGGSHLWFRSFLNNAGESGFILDNVQAESSVNGATTGSMYYNGAISGPDNTIIAETNSVSLSDPVNGPGDVIFRNGTTIKMHQEGKPGIWGFNKLTVSGKSITGDVLFSGVDDLTLSAAGDIGTSDMPLKLDVRSVDGTSWNKGDVYLQAMHDIRLGNYRAVLNQYNYSTNNYFGNSVNFVTTLLGANDGIVSVHADGDIIVNSIITPRGGVSLISDHGSINAGDAGNYIVLGPNYSAHPLTTDNHLLGADSFNITAVGTGTITGSGGYNYYNDNFYTGALTIGTTSGPNIIAGGYSYFSTPNGTIGVGVPGDKAPGVGGQLVGIVRPGTIAVTDVTPAPAVYVNGAPLGGIYYDDSGVFGEPQQAPPASNTGNHEVGGVGGSLPSMNNPLRIFIEAMPGSKSALPPGVSAPAGLLIGLPPPIVSPLVATKVALPLRIANILLGDTSLYYEILNPHLIRQVEVVQPAMTYAYHSFVGNDNTAFDDFKLDSDAYDYIDGRIGKDALLVFNWEKDKEKK